MAPCGARREAIGLLIALAVIVILMAIRFAAFWGRDAEQFLRPYQRFDSVLQGAQRTIHQSLLAVVPEVVSLREQEGQWPEAELLEMENLPPFDNRFLPAGLRTYVWNSTDGGSWIDYHGNNPGGDEPVSFILRVIDIHADYHPHPHPGIDYDPERRVAVQVWIYPNPECPYPGERLPEAGWWWVVSPNDPLLAVVQEEATPRGDEAAGPEELQPTAEEGGTAGSTEAAPPPGRRKTLWSNESGGED